MKRKKRPSCRIARLRPVLVCRHRFPLHSHAGSSASTYDPPSKQCLAGLEVRCRCRRILLPSPASHVVCVLLLGVVCPCRSPHHRTSSFIVVPVCRCCCPIRGPCPHSPLLSSSLSLLSPFLSIPAAPRFHPVSSCSRQ
jgi:hypothetical protein